MSNTQPISIPADLGEQLLTDLHRFLAAQTAKSIPTEQLLTWLAGIDAAPWATFTQGTAITARHLAKLLQPYGIVSKNIRIGNTVPKCYRVADFKDAFAKVVADKSVAANVADKVADNLENNVADRNVADKSGDVAANVADRKPVVAANVVAISNVAANVAASVPVKPARKWPPPKGWTWNHQTKGYEPPKPTVQPEPMDQELIRQTLHVSPHLKYRPGYGLVAI